MEVAPAGDRALLVSLGEVSAAELHAAAARARSREGVVAVIPGHSSLYVIFESHVRPSIDIHSLRGGTVTLETNRHRVPVSFDGADFGEFLSHARVARHEFLARVRGLTLTARYLGFRGGFAYLDGWPEEWSMPRRATSRPVPRGSFAVAGSAAGFYPIDTPGGWNLLGRTNRDLEHAIAPGDEIVIEPTDEPLAPPPPRPREAWSIDGVEVIAAPLATLVERPDWARLAHGRPPGGAFDDVAAALATRAAGANAKVIECAFAWPRLRFLDERVAAWCGPDARVRVRRMRSGEELDLGRVEGGLRGYAAIGTEAGARTEVSRGERLVVQAMRGPHDVGLSEIECEVTPSLDRVGIRLRPLRDIDAAAPADLRSCGMQCGTVQLHPDGTLVAMGPDHPVTGGYLQPMTVISSERWKLAQLLPGERVRLVAQPPY